MDVKYINSFLEALEYVLGQFGMTEVKVGALRKKENMFIEADITSIIGLVGDIRGNISFSLSEETGKKLFLP
ncbi:MAG TPA: hypothetical protein DDW50_15230 [Firmicutes bacterium]|jgi:chemotaxis protein CheX|nr:hypothetical protein [Bacillota bacterium]